MVFIVIMRCLRVLQSGGYGKVYFHSSRKILVVYTVVNIYFSPIIKSHSFGFHGYKNWGGVCTG